jgi:hypothetical protein
MYFWSDLECIARSVPNYFIDSDASKGGQQIEARLEYQAIVTKIVILVIQPIDLVDKGTFRSVTDWSVNYFHVGMFNKDTLYRCDNF